MTLVRPGQDQLSIMGVAVFIDCDSPLLPWDQVEGFLEDLVVGEQREFVIPLATTLEQALGANVCGQLGVTFTDLPSFCTPLETDSPVDLHWLPTSESTNSQSTKQDSSTRTVKSLRCQRSMF